jgi:hypothetical protein
MVVTFPRHLLSDYFTDATCHSGLHVAFRRAAAENKMLSGRRDVYAERRAGERLAVGAVADGECRGVDLRFEDDLAAMAVSVDLHRLFPMIVRGTVMHRRSGQSLHPRRVGRADHDERFVRSQRALSQLASTRQRAARDVQTIEPAFMSMVLALDIWKWRFSWPPRFPACRLEMTSSSLVEIREYAISRCPAHPPLRGESLRWTSPAIHAVRAPGSDQGPDARCSGLAGVGASADTRAIVDYSPPAFGTEPAAARRCLASS